MRIQLLPYHRITPSIDKYIRTSFGEPCLNPVNGEIIHMLPYLSYHQIKDNETVYDYYILEKKWNAFISNLMKGFLHNEVGSVLNKSTINKYLISYAKGFNAGYFSIKNTESINLDIKDNLYEIFYKVYPASKILNGDIACFLMTSEDPPREYITPGFFYQIGREGGIFYKAWEIIITKSWRYEDLFSKILTEIISLEDTKELSHFESQNKLSEKNNPFSLKSDFQTTQSGKKVSNKNIPSFVSLFRDPEHAYEVKRILEENNYTSNGNWICNGKKNSLATLYFVLSDPEPTGNIHAINSYNIENQLISFYNEFGLKIAEKTGDGIYTTIRNARKRPVYDLGEKTIYKDFNNLFSKLRYKR